MVVPQPPIEAVGPNEVKISSYRMQAAGGKVTFDAN